MNRYAYVGHNPVSYVDPMGTIAIGGGFSTNAGAVETSSFWGDFGQGALDFAGGALDEVTFGLTSDLTSSLGADKSSTAYSAGGIVTMLNPAGLVKAGVKNGLEAGISYVTKSGGGKSLYHYTDDAGLDGILKSKKLNASTKAHNPKDARYGDGQYLSDIVPGTKTNGQLSKSFLNIPWQGKKFKNYVEIDVSDLNVVKGRDGVFVVPNSGALDISKRIVGSGSN